MTDWNWRNTLINRVQKGVEDKALAWDDKKVAKSGNVTREEIVAMYESMMVDLQTRYDALMQINKELDEAEREQSRKLMRLEYEIGVTRNDLATEQSEHIRFEARSEALLKLITLATRKRIPTPCSFTNSKTLFKTTGRGWIEHLD